MILYFDENITFSCRDGQCPEYSVNDQTICAVGLSKTKPGIFVEAIQYLLILATPVEVGIFFFHHNACMLALPIPATFD